MGMKVPARKLLSKLEPENVQEKKFVLEERRLFLEQICAAECETKVPTRTSGLKRKTEYIQSKPLSSGNEVQQKRRMTKITEKLSPAQEKSERKLVLSKKSIGLDKPMNWVDGAVKKERLTDKWIPVQEKPERKPGLTRKPVWLEKEMTADGLVKKGRDRESRNQPQRNLNTEISLKSIEKDERGKVFCVNGRG